eukprot:gene21057-27286_t
MIKSRGSSTTENSINNTSVMTNETNNSSNNNSSSGDLKGVSSLLSIKVISGAEAEKIDSSNRSSNQPPGYLDSFSKNFKLFLCFVGLQLSYVTWGVVQEQLMTKEYSLGRFKSAAFCVFMNRFLALFVALAIVFGKRLAQSRPLKEAPYYYYAPSSLSNSISSWAQYEALKYVSFPTQVLSKSCKIIPVMLVGMLVNRKSYPSSEYLEAVLITFGVAMFTFSEKSSNGRSSHEDTLFGVILLATYLLSDSFTSQWQSRVYKQFGVDQYQMMLGVNVWSIVLTAASLFQSGEGMSSLAFILADSSAMFHIIILSITSATGQLFIFYTIKEFGPVVFTIIMTTRQIFSLFLSCLLFAHSMRLLSWIGSLLVFAVVFNRIYRKGSD